MPLGLLYRELFHLRQEYLAFAPETARSTIHLIPTGAGVASQLNLATGFALAAKLAENRSVVMVHLEDGFSALGFWHEAATLARSERLPMIFVARRRLHDARLAGGSELRERASAYGIPGITVDGNDVVATWRVAQESIHRARGAAGPTLIDAELLPFQATGSGDPNDPLRRMQHYLEKRALWDDLWKSGLVQKFASEIEEARAFFGGSAKKPQG
jgi:TPP-dependent pyruvate/acetoin dehydrogenase alpha subunit